MGARLLRTWDDAVANVDTFVCLLRRNLGASFYYEMQGTERAESACRELVLIPFGSLTNEGTRLGGAHTRGAI